MKKALLTLMCLAAMIAASTSLKAQEVTIVLNPGWTWMSCPTTEAMNFAAALGDFTPMQGDVIKSQWGQSTYINGQWRGSLSQFIPGYGYHYMSNRQVSVTVTMSTPLPQVAVTTANPTNITATSAVVGSTVTIEDGSHMFLRGVCWGMEPNPTIDDNHTSDETVAGSQTVTLDGLTPSTTYYVKAYMVTDSGLAYGNQQSFTTKRDSGYYHAYVDLGLPSGNLWAICNVGANTPEDYGDYFAWGETQPKSTYNWSTYQYCNGSSNTLMKYCYNPDYGYNGFTDDLTTLLPEDDAATANWGEDWRMPTQSEWQELLDNTTVSWTTQNDVNGWLFTANNGNSLFLPAAGYRNESSLQSAGSGGHYWSSQLSTSYTYLASVFHFYSDACYMGSESSSRIFGQSVRPVRSPAPTGAIIGKFTIDADGNQVYFSQGNLQYQASTNTWKFAENQYGYVGSDNSNISETYTGWIDLFGWGTSGYNHGAVCYQPWSTSSENSDYYAYGDANYNLYDQTGQADWGYNPISNGGNIANQWRTLTQSEWEYVFNTRSTTSGIRYAKAQVNNVNGVILLPDDWTSSTYSLRNTNTSDASFAINRITATQWTTLEIAGAVFLPAAGYRGGIWVGFVGSHGNYWSATCYDSYSYSSFAKFVEFDSSELGTNYGSNRSYGKSVRLVRASE